MTLLLITAEHRQRIEAIRAHAAANVIPLVRMWRIKHGSEPMPRTDAHNSLALPGGFLVAYLIEQQPSALVAHLSVSVSTRKCYPHPVAVNMLLAEFKMPPLGQCNAVWPAEQADGTNVINMLAALSEGAR